MPNWSRDFLSLFRIISWNTAKRLKRIEGQISFLEDSKADIIALQEIIPSTEKVFKRELANNYPYQISSFDLAVDKSILNKKRMFGELFLSKFPLVPQNPKNVNVPWHERILTVKAKIDRNLLTLHTTHIPPGSSNGWIKVEMIDGIVDHLIENKNEFPVVLCGDFNTPKFESKEFGLVTFAQNLKKNGQPSNKKSFRGGLGVDWDKSERSLFEKLRNHKILETFRQLNPTLFEAYSWSFSRKGKVFRHRFDHIFASDDLIAQQCEYLYPEESLSDHLPISAKFLLNH